MTNGSCGKWRRGCPPPDRGEFVEHEDVKKLIDGRYLG
jgi:predicted transcriptional regulator